MKLANITKKLNRCRTIKAVTLTSLILSSQDVTAQEQQRQKDINYCIGGTIASWATGDYPCTSSWRPSDHKSSLGINSAKITRSRPFEGKGGLELELSINNAIDGYREGEVFVDLRRMPEYNSHKPVINKYDLDGKELGVDLSGRMLTTNIFCEMDSGGQKNAPNGLQIFAKSVDVIDGKEVWLSYYGSWNNILASGNFSSPMYGPSSIKEERWDTISQMLPPVRITKDNINALTPQYGYVDKGFDPSKIAIVGIKYGLNDRAGRSTKFSRRIFIDNFKWARIPQTQELFRGLFPITLEEQVKLFTEDIVTFDFESTDCPATTMRKSGYNFGAILQTEYMESKESIVILPVTGKTHYDEEIIALTNSLKKQGLKVALKPHIDVSDKVETWRGEIEPHDKHRWFKSFTDFTLHYARLAEKHEIDMFILGTEYSSLDHENREEWKNVFTHIRNNYNGIITYAANWDSYDKVCFWDLVDVVGIDAYFPLSKETNPSKREIIEGWLPWISQISEFQKKVNKPIIFTELGYRSTESSAKEPWEYKENRPVNQELQKRCYEAAVEAFKEKEWFKGFFIWYWSPKQDDGGKFNTNFIPQNKLAQEAFISPLLHSH